MTNNEHTWTFGIQRTERETDFEDYVTYGVYLVSYLGNSGDYTLTAVATDQFMQTEAHAVVVASQIADTFRAHSPAEVIHLPTVRIGHPELSRSFRG